MDRDPEDAAKPERETLASGGPIALLDPPRAHNPLLGIETRQQKAELEAALFGEPSEPVQIGHYTIIGTLGSGGMGVVYVAHDTLLDRRVAIKLLRTSDASEIARARLAREAQAMARLSHPNVVTVHEVGDYRGQVFLAMEFVGGSNLRAWFLARPRGIREIIDIFLQAGEGLAAAHAAGVVHRDFKPDNVLVGDDGRVRVADFGLAHHVPEQDPATPEPRASSRQDDDALNLDTPLTLTGAVMGTPAYMAPEQHAGRPTDARSDQFSFCVALWEALHGERPFAGGQLAALVDAVTSGRIREPRDPTAVPAWLRTVLRRGLATKPDDRWPSMRALLHALARDPAVIRKRRLRVAAVTSVVLALITATSVAAATESRQNARQRYWNALTESLLDIERDRSLRQANDDARRARDATRMSSYRRYRPQEGKLDREDSAVAAALLREIEGDERETPAWISAANEVLGQPLSYAIFSGHRDVVVDLVFAPDSSALYSASRDDEVWRWDIATGAGRSIIRHERDVVALAVSPDGRHVASGSADARVQLWSRDTDLARTLTTHDDVLSALAFSPDGELLATASKDGVVKLVPLAGGPARTLTGHTSPVYALSFDPEGARLVTASGDGSVGLWRVADGRSLGRSTAHTRAVFHARFIDDRQIVTAADDGSVRLWLPGRSEGAELLLTTHAQPITALAVHGTRIASASQNGRIQIHDLDTRAPPVTIVTGEPVWSLSFVGAGDRLAAGAFDGSARVWTSDGRGPAHVLVGHGQAIADVAVDPSGRWLATGSYDSDVRLWDLARAPLRVALDGHRRSIYEIEIAGDQRRFVTSSEDSSVRLWSLADGRALGDINLDRGVRALAISPDDATIAAGSDLGMLALWRPDRDDLRLLEGHDGQIWQLDFDDTGARLASCALDGNVRIWSVDTGEQLLVLANQDLAGTVVDFEPGGERIVSASNDGTLRLFDAQTGVERAALTGHRGKILALARSPDGRTLATASDDQTARLWPDDDPRHALVLRGHTQPVWSVEFDASGERVLTASFDNQARIWDARDGSLIEALPGHSEALWDAHFLADGRVVTASEDNTIRLWPSAADEPVLVLSGHRDAVTDLAVSAAGTQLISGSADGKLQLWDLAQLSTDVDVLGRRLDWITIWCLDVERRVRELGDSREAAEAAWSSCERGFGR